MDSKTIKHFNNVPMGPGMTFSQLINDLRVKHAGKLLTETDLNITEICFKTGYKNLSYFNRQFKFYKKISPLDYRKKFKKEYLDSYEEHANLSISQTRDN